MYRNDNTIFYWCPHYPSPFINFTKIPRDLISKMDLHHRSESFKIRPWTHQFALYLNPPTWTLIRKQTWQWLVGKDSGSVCWILVYRQVGLGWVRLFLPSWFHGESGPARWLSSWFGVVFFPTHLKNMRKSKWVHLPHFSGCTLNNKYLIFHNLEDDF